MPTPTRAIVQISHRGVGDALHLKRLALFFDEILFVLPSFWLLNDELLNNPQRVERLSNGLIRVSGGVDPVRDTHPALKVPLGSLGEELDHTLRNLMESGVASEFDEYSLGSAEGDELFRRVRHQFAWRDARDPVFASISGTSESEYRTEYMPLTLQPYDDDLVTPVGETINIYAIFPPSAMADSVDLTTILYAADATQMSPVFTRSVHHAELAYRYEQYKTGLSILKDQIRGAVSEAEFRDQFGAVAFRLANAVITSDQVSRLTIEEVVRLRSSMEEARRRFVSEHLVSATNLIEANPWDRKLEVELERFVQGPLTADLLRFQDESKSRFEKMFGGFAGQLADITRGALIGSGPGLAGASTGVTATVMPGAAPWQMVIIAALGGAVTQAPEVARTIIDTVLEQRKARRSSIAYLAAISNVAR
jgi:hypothetical protein